MSEVECSGDLEVWQPIDRYEGRWGHRYFYSSLGRVWSECTKKIIGDSGQARYQGVTLRCTDTGKMRSMKTHQLIAELVLGPCPPGMEVNHKNGIKNDNRPKNLEYVTHRQNIRHAVVVLGRCIGTSGESHRKAKMTDSAIVELRRRHAAGEPVKTLAAAFGIGTSNTSKITLGKIWKHLL